MPFFQVLDTCNTLDSFYAFLKIRVFGRRNFALHPCFRNPNHRLFNYAMLCLTKKDSKIAFNKYFIKFS